MLVYSINADKWHCVQNLNMPALAGHRMVKGKNNKCVYMFGGLNAKGKSTNKLYKIKNISVDSNEMKW
jgi:N-acetylneuraminic acid mutarotase